MYALSALDAISPAIQRTRDILFRPFRWGTFLKLSVVALLTEGLGNNLRSTWNQHHHVSYAGGAFPPFSPSPEKVAAIAAAMALVILLGLFIAYLITRLRFAFFHCLIHNIREIRPGWRFYRNQATRFFWMNVVVGICFMALAVLALVPFAAGLWTLFRQSQSSGPIDLGLALSLVVPLIPVVLLIILAAVLLDVVLRDWMLPHYALENATAGQAWSAVWARLTREKGPFFFYAIVRVLLPAAAVIALLVILIIPGVVFAGAVAGIEIGIHSLASGPGLVAWIALQVLVVVAAATIALLVWISLLGPLSTAVREYALLFYGGRYERLGDILFPPSAPAGGTA